MSKNLNGGTSHSFPVAIAGWEIRYFHPNHGPVRFVVTSWSERHKDESWLNDGGFMYSVVELQNGAL